jgi:DNA-binding MarR family transcriptional regulator
MNRWSSAMSRPSSGRSPRLIAALKAKTTASSADPIELPPLDGNLVIPLRSPLGKVMGVDPSVLVTLLNPLEADGYISRQRDPADRRRHVVALSPTGTEHLAAAARAQRAAEDELFSGLDQEQREQLRQLLLTLQASVQPSQASPCSPPAADQC